VPALVVLVASNTSLAKVRMSPTLSPEAPVSVVVSLVACSMTVMAFPTWPWCPWCLGRGD
jgi:hypothetical protein